MDFEPPTKAGFVWFSDFGRETTRDEALARAIARLRVPESALLIEPSFAPFNAWSVFVADDYGLAVLGFRQECEMKFRALGLNWK